MSSIGDELSDAEHDVQALESNGHEESDHLEQTEAGVAVELPVRPGPALEQSSGGQHHSSEDEYDERENRFQGSSSTWRKYMHEERQLIASLDQQRAGDLSLHLYNTHALKSRYRGSIAGPVEPWKSKRRWVQPRAEYDLSWLPDRIWTAWPLHPQEVPRKNESFGVPLPDEDDSAYCKAEIWKPSSDLQSEILAIMLRRAKEQFRQRQWDQIDEVETTRTPAGAGSSDERENGLASPKYDARIPSEAHMKPEDQETLAIPSLDHAKPLLLADDEKAISILKPTVRHTLTKLDDLLLGFRKSRKGHRRHAWAPRSRSNAPARRKRPGNASDPSEDVVAEDDELDGSNYEHDSDSMDARSTPANKKRRSGGQQTHPLGLRDWSEVLGVASIVGWGPAVIDRAARRCASLFGENMSFRTIPESTAGGSADIVTDYVPDMAPPLSDTESEDDKVDIDLTAKQRLHCPYESCSRHQRIYEKAWRWREHLRRTHKLSPGRIKVLERGVPWEIVDLDPESEAEEVESDHDADHAFERGTGPTSPNDLAGGVHIDGFMQPILGDLSRASSAKARRRTSSTADRARSKRPRIEHTEVVDQ